MVAAGLVLVAAAVCSAIALADPDDFSGSQEARPHHQGPNRRLARLEPSLPRLVARPPRLNIYSHTLAGMLAPVARRAKYLVYVTPHGRHALVVEEGRNTLAFRDPHTFKLQKALNVQCSGVDHLDFSADG
ncbi:MAG TPA: hypothetical protein VGF70_09170 [Solirubrobacteraceae bacterium]|jgi:hypothetical protein